MKEDTRTKFEIWRQDDNGNRLLLGAFPDQPGAEERMAELTRNPNKQTYWITETTEEMQA
jgi:hypothetical protein